MEMLINLHSVIPFSRVNGPGSRMVIFFQGCDKECQGCFNPEIQPFENVNLYTPESVFKEYLKDGIDGITVSGGEPFLQPEGLLKLVKYAQEIYGLSTVVYTGFRYKEIRENPELYRSVRYIDVLVDGRYIDDKRETTLLARGSTNQRFCCLSGRYEKADFYMPGKIEVAISNDGVVTKTGFSKLQL